MVTILVAGSRTVTNRRFMREVLDAQGDRITTVVQGMAHGADKIGFDWAIDRCIPTCCHPADWNRYGKRAGYVRNAAMLEHHPDIEAVLLFIDKPLIESRGTKMMGDLATGKKIKVFVFDTITESRLM